MMIHNEPNGTGLDDSLSSSPKHPAANRDLPRAMLDTVDAFRGENNIVWGIEGGRWVCRYLCNDGSRLDTFLSTRMMATGDYARTVESRRTIGIPAVSGAAARKRIHRE